MNKQMIITQNDYHRLMNIIEIESAKSRMSSLADRLAGNLTHAQRLAPEVIAKSVVTMNSQVRLKDLRTGREAEVTITYPQDADARERRISVFSDIGLALLGRREGDIVSWRIPGGVGRFEIDAVMYQPEASGDYSL